MATNQNAKYHKTVDLSTTDFTDPFDWVYVQTGGNITIVDFNSVSVTITVPNNYKHEMGGKQITKATTTATGITAYRYAQAF